MKKKAARVEKGRECGILRQGGEPRALLAGLKQIGDGAVRAGQPLIGILPCRAPDLAVPNRQESDSDDEQQRADEQRQLAFNGPVHRVPNTSRTLRAMASVVNGFARYATPCSSMP